ncbi:hypothetical protein D3C81_2172230 [compost metagenome]
MHVDAVGATIDLRHPQEDEIDQGLGQPAVMQVSVYGAKGLVTVGRSLGVVEASAHGESWIDIFQNRYRAPAWPSRIEP